MTHSHYIESDPGEPLVVYRGEHGVSNTPLETRMGSLSFGTYEGALEYAKHPNNTTIDKTAESPRIISANISISKYVINNPDDPFIDYLDLVKAIGKEKAKQILLEQEDYVHHTNNWEENFEGCDLKELVEADSSRLDEIYFDAYCVFDSDLYVSWFKEAGFDGAIHGGNGVTALEPEYKVFSPEQVNILSVEDLKATPLLKAAI